MMLFSTHPPMDERISRVDPGFQPEELTRLAAKLQREQAPDVKRREKRREKKRSPVACLMPKRSLTASASPTGSAC